MKNEMTTREEQNIQHKDAEGGRVTYTPRLDVYEHHDAFHVFVDLPGVAEEDLEIQYEKQELTIRGTVKPRTDAKFLYWEYGVGDFYRTFAVPDSIDVEQISGELKNGVLTVRMPKSETVKPRKIEVKAG